jgi:hypothetical protein
MPNKRKDYYYYYYYYYYYNYTIIHTHHQYIPNMRLACQTHPIS